MLRIEVEPKWLRGSMAPSPDKTFARATSPRPSLAGTPYSASAHEREPACLGAHRPLLGRFRQVQAEPPAFPCQRQGRAQGHAPFDTTLARARARWRTAGRHRAPRTLDPDQRDHLVPMNV